MLRGGGGLIDALRAVVNTTLKSVTEGGRGGGKNLSKKRYLIVEQPHSNYTFASFQMIKCKYKQKFRPCLAVSERAMRGLLQRLDYVCLITVKFV